MTYFNHTLCTLIIYCFSSTSFASEEFSFVVEPALLQKQGEVQVDINLEQFISRSSNTPLSSSIEYGISDKLQVELGYQYDSESALQLGIAYDLSNLFSFTHYAAIEFEIEHEDGESSYETALLFTHRLLDKHHIHSNLFYENEDHADQFGVSMAHHYQHTDSLSFITETELSKQNAQDDYSFIISFGGIYELFDDAVLGVALASEHEEETEQKLIVKFSYEWE